MSSDRPPYDPHAYPPFAVTVDVVVFTIEHKRLAVALVERGQEPYKGKLALPGGFVREHESLEQTAARELAEETGLETPAAHLEQFRAYGAPDRDPRMRVVSVGFWAIVPNLGTLQAGGDAALARLLPVEYALVADDELAFDHFTILTDARDEARQALETTGVARSFCSPVFAISDLRRVYEAVWGMPLDQGNFQKKVMEIEGFLIPTGNHRTGERGRPPELYSAGPALTIDPPFRRPS